MSDRWERVGQLFEQALAAPLYERAALIERSPESDDVKNEVRSLLAAHQAGASRYGARVDHELRRNVILTAGARVGTRDYETIDREDEFFYADAGADFMFNRRVALRARIGHEEVESTGVDRFRDFEVNTATLGLSISL